MPDYGQLPVTLSDGTTWAHWTKDLPAEAVILLFMLQLPGDFRINENYISKILGTDMKERRSTDNVPNVESGQTHQYRIVNKALAMELLSSLLLCHLNMATEVKCMSTLSKDGQPHKAAPNDTTDIVARYEYPDGTLAFRVVAEVSSKKFIKEDFYRTQLNQAWNFAGKLAKDDEDGLVYGLVINGGHIGSNTTLRDWYRDFAQEKQMKLDGNVRVLPLYAGDLGSAALRIEEELPAGRLQFTAGVFSSILNALLGALLGTTASDAGDDWMRDSFFAMVPAEESDDAGGHLDPK